MALSTQMKAALWSISDTQAGERAEEEARLVAKIIRQWERRLHTKVRTVLDVPCGLGRHHGPLKRAGFDVYGVDIEPEFISLARARNKGDGKHYVVGDMRHTGLPSGSFDAVLNLFTSFGYFDRKGNMETLHEFHRLVREGGLLLLQTNAASQAGGAPVTFADNANAGIIRLVRNHSSGKSWIMDMELLKKSGSHYDIIAVARRRVRHLPIVEARPTLRRAGFKVLAVYSNYSMEPAKPKERRILVVARRE